MLKYIYLLMISGYPIAIVLLILSGLLMYNGNYLCIATLVSSALFAGARKLMGSIKII